MSLQTLCCTSGGGSAVKQTIFIWSQTGTSAPVILGYVVDELNFAASITTSRGGVGYFEFQIADPIFTFGGAWKIDSAGVDRNEYHQEGRSTDDTFYIENIKADTNTNQDGISQYARTRVVVPA